MKAPHALFVAAGNLLTAALAIAWAYASYRYDLINVGGAAGDATFWDTSLGVAYFALFSWLLTIGVGVFCGGYFRLNKLRIASYISISIFLGPALLFGVSWWLNRGFPPCNC